MLCNREAPPTPTDIYLVTGRTGGIVATVIGCLVGLILVGGCVGAAFYTSRAQWRRDVGVGLGVRSFVRLRDEEWEREEREEGRGEGKPELVEVLIEGEKDIWMLREMSEDLLPLSLELEELTKNDSTPSKPSTKAIVSFLILLPSPSLPLDVEPQLFPSSSTPSALDKEDTIQVAFGSDLVLVEEWRGEK